MTSPGRMLALSMTSCLLYTSRGLWTAENDFMGGPFVLNVVLDEKNSRIIYMMGYVYAPDGKKRNMLRQVESIVNSMKIDFPEEEKK